MKSEIQQQPNEIQVSSRSSAEHDQEANIVDNVDDKAYFEKQEEKGSAMHRRSTLEEELEGFNPIATDSNDDITEQEKSNSDVKHDLQLLTPQSKTAFGQFENNLLPDRMSKTSQMSVNILDALKAHNREFDSSRKLGESESDTESKNNDGTNEITQHIEFKHLIQAALTAEDKNTQLLQELQMIKNQLMLSRGIIVKEQNIKLKLVMKLKEMQKEIQILKGNKEKCDRQVQTMPLVEEKRSSKRFSHSSRRRSSRRHSFIGYQEINATLNARSNTFTGALNFDQDLSGSRASCLTTRQGNNNPSFFELRKLEISHKLHRLQTLQKSHEIRASKRTSNPDPAGNMQQLLAKRSITNISDWRTIKQITQPISEEHSQVSSPLRRSESGITRTFAADARIEQIRLKKQGTYNNKLLPEEKLEILAQRKRSKSYDQWKKPGAFDPSVKPQLRIKLQESEQQQEEEKYRSLGSDGNPFQVITETLQTIYEPNVTQVTFEKDDPITLIDNRHLITQRDESKIKFRPPPIHVDTEENKSRGASNASPNSDFKDMNIRKNIFKFHRFNKTLSDMKLMRISETAREQLLYNPPNTEKNQAQNFWKAKFDELLQEKKNHQKQVQNLNKNLQNQGTSIIQLQERIKIQKEQKEKTIDQLMQEIVSFRAQVEQLKRQNRAVWNEMMKALENRSLKQERKIYTTITSPEKPIQTPAPKKNKQSLARAIMDLTEDLSKKLISNQFQINKVQMSKQPKPKKSNIDKNSNKDAVLSLKSRKSAIKKTEEKKKTTKKSNRNSLIGNRVSFNKSPRKKKTMPVGDPSWDIMNSDYQDLDTQNIDENLMKSSNSRIQSVDPDNIETGQVTVEDMEEKTQNEIQQKVKFFSKNNNPSLLKSSQIITGLAPSKRFSGMIGSGSILPVKSRANSNNISQVYKLTGTTKKKNSVKNKSNFLTISKKSSTNKSNQGPPDIRFSSSPFKKMDQLNNKAIDSIIKSIKENNSVVYNSQISPPKYSQRVSMVESARSNQGKRKLKLKKKSSNGMSTKSNGMAVNGQIKSTLKYDPFEKTFASPNRKNLEGVLNSRNKGMMTKYNKDLAKLPFNRSITSSLTSSARINQNEGGSRKSSGYYNLKGMQIDENVSNGSGKEVLQINNPQYSLIAQQTQLYTARDQHRKELANDMYLKILPTKESVHKAQVSRSQIIQDLPYSPAQIRAHHLKIPISRSRQPSNIPIPPAEPLDIPHDETLPYDQNLEEAEESPGHSLGQKAIEIDENYLFGIKFE